MYIREFILHGHLGDTFLFTERPSLLMNRSQFSNHTYNIYLFEQNRQSLMLNNISMTKLGPILVGTSTNKRLQEINLDLQVHNKNRVSELCIQYYSK